MLYTKKGDGGTTQHLSSPTRVSKSSLQIEALGELDELGALLGVCTSWVDVASRKYIERVQQDLFVIQAELAGANKQIGADKTAWVEEVIGKIEIALPPIKTFLLAGGTQASAFLDLARAVARRAERRVVALHEHAPLRPELLAYMNRLSSLLYALARLSNNQSGITEKPPTYE